MRWFGWGNMWERECVFGGGNVLTLGSLQRRLLWWVVQLFWVCLFAFFVFANFQDWDTFYTFHEVDLRAWTLETAPPLWSHQLCGGVTRAGDPQSFSLSPLFLWVILFGSFWGTKGIVFFGLFMGAFFFKKMLLMLGAFGLEERDNSEKDAEIIAFLMAIFFVGSNAFLWHLVVGHVTFSLIGLAVGILYFTLKAWFGRWEAKDTWVSIPLVWCYYSAGFYFSQLFFLLPLFLSFGLVLVWQGVDAFFKKKPLMVLLRRVGCMIGFHSIGMALAFYKIFFVIDYQRRYPRVVAGYQSEELISVVRGLFLPTWSERFVGVWQPLGRLGMWEKSYFHVSAWGLLIFFVWWLWRKKRNHVVENIDLLNQKKINNAQEIKEAQLYEMLWFWRWLVLGAMLVIGFSLGNTFPFSPHTLLNTYVFQGSVRVVARYQVGLVFLVSCAFGVLVLRGLPERVLFLRILAAPLLLVLFLNMVSFLPWLSFDLLKENLRYKRTTQRKMTHISFESPFQKRKLAFRKVTFFHSSMYRSALLGVGLIRCYNPIHRKNLYLRRLDEAERLVLFRSGNRRIPFSQRKTWFFIDTRKTPISLSCKEKSFFTQNNIHLHASCPKQVCLRMGQPNLYRETGFRWFPDVRRYCRLR